MAVHSVVDNFICIVKIKVNCLKQFEIPPEFENKMTYVSNSN